MNEELRLRMVRQFEKLKLEYNKELQLMMLFAAKLCKTPISLITLQDKNVELLKIHNNLNTRITPSELSLCCHPVKRNDVMVINDTYRKSKFCNYAAAEQGIKIRFCAAAPLVTQEDLTIGTLCVMDYKPHVLTVQEKLILKILARHVIGVMELKLSLDKLNKNFNELKEERKARVNNEIRLRAMFESLTDCYFLLGLNGELMDFNRAAFEAVFNKYGVRLDYCIILKDILDPAYRVIFDQYFNEALKGNKKHLEKQTEYDNRGKIWWDCVFEPIRNAHGEVFGVSCVARNISETKLNKEKIAKQNHLLTRIAEIQSHDYRGPVASILGLMNLIEAENYEAPKEYLFMLRESVKKLDEKIHEVVSIIDKI